MKIKKMLAVLLSITLVLSFSGCAIMKLVEPENQEAEVSQEVSNLESHGTPEPTSTPEPTPEPTAEPTATPEPTEAPTPTAEPVKADTNETIEGIIAKMSLEEKVGQLFIVRCPEGDVTSEIANYNIGNLILFARDFENNTKEQVIENISSYQNAAKIPMLIGVDEEGGDVTRISCYSQFCEENYMSPRQLFDEGGLDAIIAIEQDKINVLKELGINMNFAPVCDISTNESDFMYSRSLGQDAATTAEFASRTAELYKENNMACVLKHFPGYGNNVDTHTGIAYDERSLESLESNDLVPFKEGSKSGEPAILVAHNVVKCFDENDPASLSAAVHQYIRENVGFNGVVLTDDLFMDAIKDFTDSNSAAVAAIKAGNDLLCCTDYKDQIPAVIAAVNSGDVTEERINESLRRVLKWKMDLGIITE